MAPFRAITYANVTSTVALVLAVCGTSYAAFKLPEHSVGSRELKRAAVDSRALKRGVVDLPHIQPTLRGQLRNAIRRVPTPTVQTKVGPTGPTGDQGPKGDAGALGGQGPRGEIGNTGEKGDQGDKGDQGLKGDTGALGGQGPRGEVGNTGEKGDQGDKGDQGLKGEQGPPGPSDLDVPAAGNTQRNAATFAFGGQLRAAIGQQALEPRADTGYPDQSPGAGIFEVRSMDGRVSQFTHYQYGTTIRATGPNSNIMELWLGDYGTLQPNFSVLGNGNGLGALVQARDAYDTVGLELDFKNALRPRLTLEDNGRARGTVLSVDNPQPDGSVVLGTKTSNEMVDRLVVDKDGVHLRDTTSLGDNADTPIRLHGTSRSGRQQPDPGVPPSDLTAADVSNADDIAKEINLTRTSLEALRQALLEHGLIG